ncbi:FCH-domain-containing protein [Viridothelium virens]|uniref:Protein BZZ1 n=1 Tax=Viridothelium virens TaxID=1048519 RepID=A0A6A6GUR2_VIRVR|nr:FCH-domain-containing protein [Viridothelium virens]
MAEVDVAPHFGAELKDGFKPANAWVSNGIAWLDDVQQFYRDRSVIEREYSQKLGGLARKYFEKKAKRQSSLSVGDNPTVTPGSLESASMTTWATQLSTIEQTAAEHEKLATQLVASIADPIKHAQNRYEELRKLHVEYAGKLEKERDSSYAELRKVKGKYDNVCQEVENRRKKTDTSFDHSKAKAQGAYHQQLSDMHDNTYLIAINVTNKQKERYYYEYVPDLLDSLQDLSETRVARLNSLWMLGTQIETATLTQRTSLLQHLSSEIPRNNPALDSMMFVRHNTTNWQDPLDFAFEPSPVWLDEATMAIDETAKVFLRNLLTKSKGSLSELRRESDAKHREVDNFRRVRQNVREGKDNRDEVEVVRSVFALQEAAHDLERKKISAEVEVSTITSAAGDLTLGARHHNFKPTTFKIPTNCDLCGDRIWGLSAKGFDCRDCGFTCHSKCELKVPADCPGEQNKDQKKQLKQQRQADASTAPPAPTNGSAPAGGGLDADDGALSRSGTINSMNTLSSGRSVSKSSVPTHIDDEEPPKPDMSSKPKIGAGRSRIVAPPPAQYITTPSGAGSTASDEQRGRVMYPYQENAEGEITVDEGQDVVILDPDDGSGWMKVRAGPHTGLVPASYVEPLPSAPTPTTTTTTASSSSLHPHPHPHPYPSESSRPNSTHSATGSSTSLASTAPSTTGAGIGTVKKKGPAVAPKRGAKKLQYVEALYDYEARSESEHGMAEGERFVLVQKDQGDGWAEVERGGRTASVPAAWVREV